MATDMKDRRELFREYMRRLTAGAAPKAALAEGLYIPPPEKSIAERLVPRLDLSPTASHLIVGGIGTGKTTELLWVEKQLSSLPDIRGVYVDVGRHQDLSTITTGALVIIAGLALDTLLSELGITAAAKERRQLKRLAHGYSEWFLEDHNDEPDYEPDDEPPNYRVDYPAILVPPEPPLENAMKTHVDLLRELVDVTRSLIPHVVLMLDSLDRIAHFSAFEEIVIQDVRAIRDTGIGTVLVGPLAILFGAHRPVADRFDYLYQVSSVDVAGYGGVEFLTRVLHARIPPSVLSEQSAGMVAHYSGGILRDLLAIARTAAEEAYIQGDAAIEISHVLAAVDTFGRDLMLGLSQSDIETLQRVRSNGTFIQTSDDDIALLATRRVIAYGVTERRYVVHPSIDSLLMQLSAK